MRCRFEVGVYDTGYPESSGGLEKWLDDFDTSFYEGSTSTWPVMLKVVLVELSKALYYIIAFVHVLLGLYYSF